MPEFSPISPSDLTGLISERARTHRGRVLVGIDGADAADPVALADAVVADIGSGGGAAHRISLHDYVRPASLRFEYGKNDELSYRTTWFDLDGLRREVIEPLRRSGTWLPALWDEASDRSPRAAVETAADTEVLVIAGPMLLGRDLDLDVTVRLVMTEGALRRRTPPDEQWTVEPLLAHAATITETPDFVLRWEHPDRPALAV